MRCPRHLQTWLTFSSFNSLLAPWKDTRWMAKTPHCTAQPQMNVEYVWGRHTWIGLPLLSMCTQAVKQTFHKQHANATITATSYLGSPEGDQRRDRFEKLRAAPLT